LLGEIVAELENPDAQKRLSAIGRLREIAERSRSDGALPLLKPIIDNAGEEKHVALAAVGCLTRACETHALDLLRSALKSKHAAVRREAIKVLGSIGGEKSAETLRTVIIAGRAQRDREEAVRALAGLGRRKAKHFLRDYYAQDGSKRIRGTIVQVFARFWKQDMDKLNAAGQRRGRAKPVAIEEREVF
jgi:HEAT repeats